MYIPKYFLMLRIAIQNFLLKPTYKHQFSNPDCYTTRLLLHICTNWHQSGLQQQKI